MMVGRGRLILEHLELANARLLSHDAPVQPSLIHTYAVVVAGVFVLITLSLSTFLIFEHLTSYNDPEEQKWLIGVIFMVPVYTVSSFLSLWHPELSLACNILGNCYEAYALYSFGCYLIACLGGEDKVVEFLEREGKLGPRTPLLANKTDPLEKERRAEIEHTAPLSWCIENWELGSDFYIAVKFGIVQYVILKSLCAIFALILDFFGLYNEGEFTIHDGYPYITLVLNFSQTWALYCLIQFYSQTHEELKSINPLAKFICFKSIVFATWWQGVIISLVFGSGWVKLGPNDLSGGKFQTFLQDFIICCEDYNLLFEATAFATLVCSLSGEWMGFAAVAHIYVFPATPYQMMGRNRRRGSVSVLADYASIDSPLDPEEVRESEKPAMMKFTVSCEDKKRDHTSVRQSVQDIVVVGGGHVVQDMRLTFSQAVEPMEKGITKFNNQLPWSKNRREKEKKSISKDDSWVGTSAGAGKPIKGIDDPLIVGSISDSGVVVRKKSMSYGSGAESSGESSDQGMGGFKTGGRRWTVKR